MGSITLWSLVLGGVKDTRRARIQLWLNLPRHARFAKRGPDKIVDIAAEGSYSVESFATSCIGRAARTFALHCRASVGTHTPWFEHRSRHRPPATPKLVTIERINPSRVLRQHSTLRAYSTPNPKGLANIRWKTPHMGTSPF